MRRVEPTLSSEDDWYRHYDLDRDPFAEGGVQGLFYPGGARQETVEQLQHLARFSDCVLLVTGIPGMGKTATRRHFVAQSAADTRCCVLEAALLEGPEPWLRRVLSGFGLRSQPRAGTDADLQQLVQFCADRLAAGSQSWLVIDDAQHMHEDVLQFLPRLLQAAGRNLRVVLFAEPDWREQLQTVMPSGVPLHTIELQPLERGETYAYIHYRMNTAGLEGESPFNAAELEQIHRNADGIPAEINAEARAALLGGIKVVQEPLNSLPMWHFGVIAATLLALLLLYAWTGMNESEQQPPVPIPGLAPVTELDTGEGAGDAGIAAAEPDAEQLAADGATAAEPSTGAGTSAAPAKPDAGPVATPAADMAVAAAPAAAPAPAAAKAVAPPAPVAPPAAKPAPVAAPAPKPAPVAKVVPDASGPSLSEAEALEAELRAAMPLEGPGAPRQPAEPVRPAPGMAATAPAKPKPTVKPAPQPAPKAAPKVAPKAAAPSGDYVYRGGNRAGGALTADEQYLVGQPTGNFVLQIMGSDDPARVRSFIARAGVPLRVYRKLNNGKEWYSVVYGNYASRAAADKAQKNLPRGLAGSKPWVRRLDAVQKEIRAARAL